LAGALLFDEKIRKVLLYFGLDGGMLEIDVSPAFLEHGSVERSWFEHMQKHDPNK
jgi:hypothetical protein